MSPFLRILGSFLALFIALSTSASRKVYLSPGMAAIRDSASVKGMGSDFFVNFTNISNIPQTLTALKIKMAFSANNGQASGTLNKNYPATNSSTDIPLPVVIPAGESRIFHLSYSCGFATATSLNCSEQPTFAATASSALDYSPGTGGTTAGRMQITTFEATILEDRGAMSGSVHLSIEYGNGSANAQTTDMLREINGGRPF